MVKKTENGANLAPFLVKLYEMVDDQSTDNTISWSQSSDSFVILDVTEFSRELLPKYFKHSNFSSFMRQLNIYGFRKVDTDRWEFANEGFIMDQKQLLVNIKRRKNPPAAVQAQQSLQGEVESVDELKEVDNSHLQKEVEILNGDKNVLAQEFVKLREHQATSQNKLLVLRERLQGMEKSQQQMLSFIAMVAQSPGFLVQLCQQKDGNWRVAESGKITPLRHVSKDDKADDKASSADGLIIRYQPPSNDAQTGLLSAFHEPEKTIELDHPSFDGAKEFFMNIDFPPLLASDSTQSLENHGQIVLSELDFSLLDQILLSTTSPDNSENTTKLQEEEPVDLEMEMDSESAGTEFDESETQSAAENYKFLGPDVRDQNRDLELLTEQLGYLSPRRTRKDEMM
ncbi:hypothetical protein Dimus_031044 [Dionaea muscipula]